MVAVEGHSGEGRGFTVSAMDLAGWSGTGGSPVPAVRGGIVSRCELSGRLGRAARVTEVSAATGSGKTLLLLRSWIGEAGLTERAAWVSVQPEERDAQRFSLPVLDALRELTIGEVAAVMDQCSPRALTGICHRSGPAHACSTAPGSAILEGLRAGFPRAEVPYLSRAEVPAATSSPWVS